MAAVVYILKIVLIVAAIVGWNESKKSKRLPPRYWYGEKKFKPDSVIRKINDSAVYVIKLRKL